MIKTLFKYEGSNKGTVLFHPAETVDSVSNTYIWASNKEPLCLNINEKFAKILTPGKRYVVTIEEDPLQPVNEWLNEETKT